MNGLFKWGIMEKDIIHEVCGDCENINNEECSITGSSVYNDDSACDEYTGIIVNPNLYVYDDCIAYIQLKGWFFDDFESDEDFEIWYKRDYIDIHFAKDHSKIVFIDDNGDYKHIEYDFDEMKKEVDRVEILFGD